MGRTRRCREQNERLPRFDPTVAVLGQEKEVLGTKASSDIPRGALQTQARLPPRSIEVLGTNAVCQVAAEVSESGERLMYLAFAAHRWETCSFGLQAFRFSSDGLVTPPLFLIWPFGGNGY